jgi:SAM-dependent methyltransferase
VDSARREILEVLRHNHGFDEPETWVDLALRQSFKRVAASPLNACPDCGALPGDSFGSFVHYSTLFTVLLCCDCGLYWADAIIDPEVTERHFESHYKDEEYFRWERQAIFRDLVELIVARAPVGGTVLDVGGATGYLMSLVGEQRPDLHLVVQDISKEALDVAEREFGLETIHGNATSLALASPVDVLVLADVIYYEPSAATLWSEVGRLVRPGGSIILRVPNKLGLMKIDRLLRRGLELIGRRRFPPRIRFLNVEHRLILSRKYIRKRLTRSGFDQIRFVPTPMLGAHRSRKLRLYFQAASVLNAGSGGRLVLTPAVVVVAQKG